MTEPDSAGTDPIESEVRSLNHSDWMQNRPGWGALILTRGGVELQKNPASFAYRKNARKVSDQGD